MAVPLLDLGPVHDPLAEELQEAFARVLASSRFVLGQEVEQFEAEAAEWIGARHAIGISSGTDALLVALMAHGIGPGDEVLVPSFTFFATAGSVARVGARPVFVDVCPRCFTIDPEDAAQKATPATRAILPVHLFGQTAPMDALLALAAERDWLVIEDVAQAMGATYMERPCGTLGSFGAYSFFPTKNLGALGDAGLLVTGDDELARRARFLRNHGDTGRYHHELIGGNFRIDALQAALLRVKLPHLTAAIDQRRALAGFYLRELAGLPEVSANVCGDCACRAESIPEPDARVLLPVETPQGKHTWNQFTIRLTRPGERDGLRKFLAERQIGHQVYYPEPLDAQPCFADVVGDRRTANAALLSQQVLSLPIFPGMNGAQQDEVVGAIADFLSGRT